MSKSNSPRLLELELAEANITDVGRWIARLSKESMKALEVSIGDVVEVSSDKGGRGFARCYPMHPDDENVLYSLSASSKWKMQLDGVVRQNLNLSLGDPTFGLGDIVRVRRVAAPYADSVTVKPFKPPFEPLHRLPRGGVDTRWFLAYLEEKLVWEQCMILVTFRNEPYHFKVVSIQPKTNGPCIVTMRTSLKMIQGHV